MVLSLLSLVLIEVWECTFCKMSQSRTIIQRISMWSSNSILILWGSFTSIVLFNTTNNSQDFSCKNIIVYYSLVHLKFRELSVGLNWSIEEKRPQIPFDTIFSKLSLKSHIFWFCISGLGIDPLGLVLNRSIKAINSPLIRILGQWFSLPRQYPRPEDPIKKTLESDNLREREGL